MPPSLCLVRRLPPLRVLRLTNLLLRPTPPRVGFVPYGPVENLLGTGGAVVRMAQRVRCPSPTRSGPAGGTSI
jgi:hypothetical protein